MRPNDRLPRRGRAESYGAVLRRLGTRWSVEATRTIGGWIEELPGAVAAEIGGRFWSDHVAHSASAFWEIYLHRTFRAFGFEVQFHPRVPNSSARPDFLVHTASGNLFVEASSLLADATTQRESRFADELRLQLTAAVPDQYRLAISLESIGSTPPDQCPFSAWLRDWIRLLPATPPAAGISARFEQAPWAIEVTALAATTDGDFEIDERKALRVAISGPGHTVIDEARFLDVIAVKASKYGALPHPLIIAVHANSSTTFSEHAHRALYGDPIGESILVTRSREPSPQITDVRTPVWCERSRCAHIGGVVVADVFTQPWSLSQSSPVMHLPRRKTPSEINALPWPRVNDAADFETPDVFNGRLAVAARLFEGSGRV